MSVEAGQIEVVQILPDIHSWLGDEAEICPIDEGCSTRQRSLIVFSCWVTACASGLFHWDTDRARCMFQVKTLYSVFLLASWV